MKKQLLGYLTAISMITAMGAIAPMAQAVFTAAVVSDAGVLRNGQDHYFEVTVEGEALQRIRVQCITFHKFDGLEISVGGETVSPDIHYGFEEFTLTFNEPIADQEKILIVMRNSQVLGSINGGIDVPFRVYGTYASLNNSEVPLGTAVIRTPGGGSR